MFNWLRGKRNEGASESKPRKNYTGYRYNQTYYNDGMMGRNDSFTADKWGAAAAVISTPYAFAIVNKIVADFESIPYRIVRDADGAVIADNENIGNDPLLRALDDYATRHDGFSLFGYWALHKFQTGEAYVELVRNDYGRPRGLEMLNSLFVTKQVVGDEVIFFYGAGNYQVRYTLRELVFDRFKTNIFTEIDGTPPLLSNLNSGTLSALRSSGRAMLAYFENDGLPRALVTPTDASGRSWDTQEEQNTIKRALDLNRGAGSKYKTQIFPYPIDISIFDAPDLTQWMGGVEQSEKYIFSVYGIPPSVVGLSFDTRYQVSEQDVPNYKRAMTSYMQSIEATINTNILPFFGYPEGVRFEFDLERYATFDAGLIDRANTAYAQGAISLNEYRRIMGFDELDNADDVYMLPAGAMPITLQQLTSGQLPMIDAPMLPMQTSSMPDVIEGKVVYERMALDELKAWRRVTNKCLAKSTPNLKRALDFNCQYIPQWLEDHIKSALEANEDPAKIFAIATELLDMGDDEIVSIWERLNLASMIEDINDHENT